MDGIDITPERDAGDSPALRLMAPHRGRIVDCDLHPAPPATPALLPYFAPAWQDIILTRGIERFALNLAAYPPGAPLTARADRRLPPGPDGKPRRPGSDLDIVRAQALDRHGARFAVVNLLHAAQYLHGDDIGAAFCRALNDWTVAELLNREPRLRASIVVPVQNPHLAAEEIDRCAADRRFVQVLLPGAVEQPLGKRNFWPIYEAAERHNLPVGIHAGSGLFHPTTPAGWPSTYIEDYVAFGGIAENQMFSLIAEGVFVKYPGLKLVMIESGFMGLPVFMWRADKLWHAARTETPWLHEPPSETVREHVRFTLQPVDDPPDPAMLLRVIEHMGSDRLILFSSDYPHWQYDGDEVLPPGMTADLARKILVENPMDTYPRLVDEDGADDAKASEETPR